ncbi:hypothetical protein CR513_62061, partial [Mucuna pruriens]
MSTLPAANTNAAADADDDAQIAFTKRRCMSFCCMPSFPSQTTSWWWEDLRSPTCKERWWFRRWKTAREWSEISAAPKWRTFIRRFKNNNINKRHRGSFRYDPLSYALNFDDGSAAVDDGCGYKGFSARFASVPPPPKAAADSCEDHVPPVSILEE